PHIDTVETWCKPLFDEPSAWQAVRDAVTAIGNRHPLQLRMERRDGTVLDCTALPLPDGATMLTFEDVTDSVNVERALRERNEAL
ncbi:UNVERIFIED_CONTAM: PAS-domain containing protein, partial [Bacteroidetes bacterium 56_B9]